MNLAITFFMLIAATPPADSPPPAASIPEPVAKQMREIIIPLVKFEDVELEEAIDFLRMKTADHQRKKGKAAEGMSFVLLHPTPQGGAAVPPPEPKRVTLSLRGASLHEVLTKTCTAAGYRWHVAPSGITIVSPADDPRRELSRPLPKELNGTQKFVLEKLRTTIIPNLHVDEVTLDELVAYLRHCSKEHSPEEDPAKRGLSFVIKDVPRAGADEQTISLQLKKIPLIEALDIVCAGCERHWHLAEDGKVIIGPKPAP